MHIFFKIFRACFSKLLFILLFPVIYLTDRKRNLLFMETVNSGSYRVGGRSLHLEYLAPLLIWRTVQGVLRPQKFEVYFHVAGPQHEATQMDGVPRGL